MRKERNEKFRINVMDILIILLVILCIVSISFRAWQTKDMYAIKEYSVYFCIDDIRYSSYEFFDGHAGEAVRTLDGQLLGTLGDDFVHGVPFSTYTVDKVHGIVIASQSADTQGEDDNTSQKERCSIAGNVVVCGKMSGKEKSNGVFLDGDIYIGRGNTVDIKTEYIQATIKILDIVEK